MYKAGDWFMLPKGDIGYLDQHYNTIEADKSVFEIIKDVVPSWSHAEIRNHLNDFLFKKTKKLIIK